MFYENGSIDELWPTKASREKREPARDSKVVSMLTPSVTHALILM